MNKQAGFIDQQTALVLLGGVLVFVTAILIIYGALNYWNVGANASGPRCPTCIVRPHFL